MTIEEKLLEIVNEKAEVIHRGNISSGDDIHNHWYECFEIRMQEKKSEKDFFRLCSRIIEHYSKRRLEYSTINFSFSIHIENSLLLQRKEKLENLKNYE